MVGGGVGYLPTELTISQDCTLSNDFGRNFLAVQVNDFLVVADVVTQQRVDLGFHWAS